MQLREDCSIISYKHRGSNEEKQLRASYVVSTIPIGVLKAKQDLLFNPPMPADRVIIHTIIYSNNIRI